MLMKQTQLLKPAAFLLPVLALCCWNLFCSDVTRPINGRKTHDALLQQVQGCQRAGLANAVTADSCFAYQFEDDLKLEFCVIANCCPDTNRFKLASVVRQDTIAIAVADTAARLCHCVCPYLIRAEFRGLPGDHYVVVCSFGDSLWLVQHVYRKD